MNNGYKGYKFFSKFFCIVGDIYFRGKINNKKNIPLDGPFILAGNHTSNYDCYLIFKALKKPVHILAKKELFNSKLCWFCKVMHLIPVDRSKKNPLVREKVIKYLQEEKIILIFPEGTFHKNIQLLPFKPGVIDFSLKTNSLIVPFAIKGKFGFLKKPEIFFGEPFYAKDIEGDKLKYLEQVILNLLIR